MKDNNNFRFLCISNWMLLLVVFALAVLCFYMFNLSEFLNSVGLLHKKFAQNLEEVFPVATLSLCLIVLGILTLAIYAINIFQLSKIKKALYKSEEESLYGEPNETIEHKEWYDDNNVEERSDLIPQISSSDSSKVYSLPYLEDIQHRIYSPLLKENVEEVRQLLTGSSNQKSLKLNIDSSVALLSESLENSCGKIYTLIGYDAELDLLKSEYLEDVCDLLSQYRERMELEINSQVDGLRRKSYTLRDIMDIKKNLEVSVCHMYKLKYCRVKKVFIDRIQKYLTGKLDNEKMSAQKKRLLKEEIQRYTNRFFFSNDESLFNYNPSLSKIDNEHKHYKYSISIIQFVFAFLLHPANILSLIISLGCICVVTGGLIFNNWFWTLEDEPLAWVLAFASLVSSILNFIPTFNDKTKIYFDDYKKTIKGVLLSAVETSKKDTFDNISKTCECNPIIAAANDSLIIKTLVGDMKEMVRVIDK